MSRLIIRPVDARAFEIAVEWAAAEGWNPGLNDLSAFHATDPGGFLMGYRDGEPVSCISAVRYGLDFGFLGFYIVHPDHRGTGVGIATWEAGMALLADRTIGLDGVVDQQQNYRKSGFELTGRNVRYRGRPNNVENRPGTARALSSADISAIVGYDRNFFPAPRENFVRRWCEPRASGDRRTVLAEDDGGITGYGTIRRCRSGYKIGPLFADSDPIASDLFRALCGLIVAGEDVSLDTPQENHRATRLAESAGLVPVFETARMYKGTGPELPTTNIYGITAFELG